MPLRLDVNLRPIVYILALVQVAILWPADLEASAAKVLRRKRVAGGKFLVINKGSRHGVRKGQRICVYRRASKRLITCGRTWRTNRKRSLVKIPGDKLKLVRRGDLISPKKKKRLGRAKRRRSETKEPPLLAALDADFFGSVNGQLRFFPGSVPGNVAIDKEQVPATEWNPSVAVLPEFFLRLSAGGTHEINGALFARADSEDEKRTHADVRELYFLTSGEHFELSLGIKKVFWGVTDSTNVIDVINQRDFIESPNGEAKLGQPMVDLAVFPLMTEIRFLVMPVFRPLTFPGEDSRFNPPVEVLDEEPTYESVDEHLHVDYAVRFKKTISLIDLGLMYFKGTNRVPQLLPEQVGFEFFLRPYYYQVEYTGGDVQISWDRIILKGEVAQATTVDISSILSVGGIQYNMPPLMGKYDTILYLEYLGKTSVYANDSPLDDSIFAGMGMAFNDPNATTLRLGIFDQTSSKISIIAGGISRRFLENIQANLQYFKADLRDHVYSSAVSDNEFWRLDFNLFF